MRAVGCPAQAHMHTINAQAHPTPSPAPGRSSRRLAPPPLCRPSCWVSAARGAAGGGACLAASRAWAPPPRAPLIQLFFERRPPPAPAPRPSQSGACTCGSATTACTAPSPTCSARPWTVGAPRPLAALFHTTRMALPQAERAPPPDWGLCTGNRARAQARWRTHTHRVKPRGTSRSAPPPPPRPRPPAEVGIALAGATVMSLVLWFGVRLQGAWIVFFMVYFATICVGIGAAPRVGAGLLLLAAPDLGRTSLRGVWGALAA